MSDDAYNDDDFEDESGDADEQTETKSKGNVHARLRRAEKERDEAAERATQGEAAIRENAFLRAGINLDDPKLKAFAKTYEGEMTAEAILAQAVSDGWVEPPPPSPELQEAEAAARVAAGGTPTGDTKEADKAAALAKLGPKATPYDVARIVAEFDGEGAVVN